MFRLRHAHLRTFFSVIILSQFFETFVLRFLVFVCLSVLVCACACVCARALPSDCSGEHHEGEDAQERREVVVLLARQEQRQQSGTLAPGGSLLVEMILYGIYFSLTDSQRSSRRTRPLSAARATRWSSLAKCQAGGKFKSGTLALFSRFRVNLCILIAVV